MKIRIIKTLQRSDVLNGLNFNAAIQALKNFHGDTVLTHEQALYEVVELILGDMCGRYHKRRLVEEILRINKLYKLYELDNTKPEHVP